MFRSLFLFLVMMSSISHATMVGHVAAYMSKKGVGPVAMVSIAIGILVLITLIVVSEIRKAEKFHNKKLEIGWAKFDEIAAEKRLKPEDIKLLKRLLTYNDSPNVELVFSSAVVFENCLEAFYAKNESSLKEEDFVNLRGLRDVLGYARIPMEVPLSSSRQFQPQTPVKLLYGDLFSQGRIEMVSEAEWSVSGIAALELEKGSEIRVSFTRNGDAEYAVTTVVSHLEEGSAILKHSRKLNRQQLRNWVRIDVNFPMMVRTRIMDRNGSDLNLEFKGKMMDLSGGGASFNIQEKLADRATVFLNFDLPKHSFKSIKGVITRIAEAPLGVAEMYRHSLEFVDLDTVEREKIVRYVFDKQRQDNQWR